MRAVLAWCDQLLGFLDMNAGSLATGDFSRDCSAELPQRARFIAKGLQVGQVAFQGDPSPLCGRLPKFRYSTCYFLAIQQSTRGLLASRVRRLGLMADCVLMPVSARACAYGLELPEDGSSSFPAFRIAGRLLANVSLRHGGPRARGTTALISVD